VEEALTLLEQGTPLAGGTTLTPNRYRLEAVVDLQDLGMAALESQDGKLEVGAGCSLQQVVEADSFVPPPLADACRREAAWNLRNMATIGGSIVAATGRSYIAAALLAMDAEVYSLPSDRWIPLDEYLNVRGSDPSHRLITKLRWSTHVTLRFAGVGRTPADWPIVLAAMGRDPEGTRRVVLGGWGERPVRVPEAEAAWTAGDPAGAGKATAKVLAESGDEWASAAYRAEVGAVLVRRLASEDVAPGGAKGKA
jgi:CO/xanthine dehydrogenase FAD-binding subunit